MTIGSPIFGTRAANRAQVLFLLNSHSEKEHWLDMLKTLVQDRLVVVRFAKTVHGVLFIPLMIKR